MMTPHDGISVSQCTLKSQEHKFKYLMQVRQCRQILREQGIMCRCLEAGSFYDMPATYRLIQLWFNLAAEKQINNRMEEAFKTIPSFKLLSLVYQMASRMTISQSGPLHTSRFQVT